MAQQDNPFVYGEIVPASAFVDREDETDRLVRNLSDGQKVFLISPRRYGKSSLIRQVFQALAKRKVLTLEVSVSSFSSYIAFLEGYARALLAMETRAERVRSWMHEMFTAFRPEVQLDSSPGAFGAGGFGGGFSAGGSSSGARGSARGGAGKRSGGASARGGSGARGSGSARAVSSLGSGAGLASAGGSLQVSFPTVRTARDAARLAEEVFALPARIAEKTGRRLAIALDEFQAVAAFDDGTVEHALRAAVQQQRQVGYVFAGSEPSLMEQMISPKRPFFKAGPVMRLEKIPPDIFAAFLEAQFKRGGLRPEPGLGAAIVELAGNLPYDVQRLAHETWDDALAGQRRGVGLDDLHDTLRRLLAEQAMLFEGLWQRLTLAQRACLRAVVLEQGRELLGTETRTRHRLGGASSVQASLNALLRLDLIARESDGRYVAVDSLLREWVARRTF